MNLPSAGALAPGFGEDHVHILCNLSRTVTIAQLVEEVKKATSKWIKEQGQTYPG